MRRIAGAVVIWLLIVGGVGIYTGSRNPTPPPLRVGGEAVGAEGRWVVELQTSFMPEADPFLTAGGDVTTEPAVVILCNGRVVPIASGSVLRRPLAGVTAGRSEILADVSPPVAEAGRAHAVRLRVLRDGLVVAETTAWSAPGTRVVTSVVVDGGAP